MKFTAQQILHGFRDMSNGGKFFIQDQTFFSINSYTFKQCEDGMISSITFKENGLMPPSKDANGNDRPETKATVIETVESTELAARITGVRTKRVENEELSLKIDGAKLTKQLKELDAI